MFFYKRSFFSVLFHKMLKNSYTFYTKINKLLLEFELIVSRYQFVAVKFETKCCTLSLLM